MKFLVATLRLLKSFQRVFREPQIILILEEIKDSFRYAKTSIFDIG